MLWQLAMQLISFVDRYNAKIPSTELAFRAQQFLILEVMHFHHASAKNRKRIMSNNRLFITNHMQLQRKHKRLISISYLII